MKHEKVKTRNDIGLGTSPGVCFLFRILHSAFRIGLCGLDENQKTGD
jgi:hypothetical protein